MRTSLWYAPIGMMGASLKCRGGLPHSVDHV